MSFQFHYYCLSRLWALKVAIPAAWPSVDRRCLDTCSSENVACHTNARGFDGLVFGDSRLDVRKGTAAEEDVTGKLFKDWEVYRETSEFQGWLIQT